MALTSGTKLGPYEIQSPLGAGGMGEVYRARDTRLDRTVAIKIIHVQLQGDQDLRTRFEREARAISSLQHPHICTLFDVGRQENTDYLVMEYLEGETLAARLVNGPLPLDQVLRVGVQIADPVEDWLSTDENALHLSARSNPRRWVSARQGDTSADLEETEALLGGRLRPSR